MTVRWILVHLGCYSLQAFSCWGISSLTARRRSRWLSSKRPAEASTWLSCRLICRISSLFFLWESKTSPSSVIKIYFCNSAWNNSFCIENDGSFAHQRWNYSAFSMLETFCVKTTQIDLVCSKTMTTCHIRQHFLGTNHKSYNKRDHCSSHFSSCDYR